MKDKIIQKAVDSFLNIGFKSVTMDDIANDLGISKKTIYTYFKNKRELVEASVMQVFYSISLGIDHICALESNAIEELFNVKDFIVQHLKGEKNSPQYQLKKYYPKLFVKLQKLQYEVMSECITKNLERGMEDGLYRQGIDLVFTTKIYFSCMNSIKDAEFFPEGIQNMQKLMESYLDYHIRAISTKKGLKKLETILSK